MAQPNAPSMPPDAQTDGIAGAARDAAVDGREAPAGVLRHMRRNVDLAQLGDEVLCLEALVVAQREETGAFTLGRITRRG